MRIHFTSIGGSVMHQLAIALLQKGYQITGSDDEIFEPSKSVLAANGLLPEKIGWNPDLIDNGLDAVILGMHARADNPELLKATALGVRVFSFPEYIYQESLEKTRVVIGGSHGKTTTTSMIMHVLQSAGQQFDYLVGARLLGFNNSVHVSSAPVIICEGDEYPASAIERRPKFHFLFPHIAVITGIAWDHINVFPTFDNYLAQFRMFIDKLAPNATLIYNSEDAVLQQLVQEHSRSDIRLQPYGIPSHHLQDNTTFVTIDGLETALQVFGNHNLLNLNAAWLVCQQLGMSAAAFIQGIGSFTGASKRLEVLASGKHSTVFRDFAHAPSKVKATMEAVRQQFNDRTLVAVLELHTYSSLNPDFMPHYAGALDAADEACVFYSPHAMEIKQMAPLPESVVVKGFAKTGLQVFTKREKLEDWLATLEKKHANLLLMSSGTYDGMDLAALANDWITA